MSSERFHSTVFPHTRLFAFLSFVFLSPVGASAEELSVPEIPE